MNFEDITAKAGEVKTALQTKKRCRNGSGSAHLARQAERWLSGLKRTPGKREWVNTPPGVRISLSPPSSALPAQAARENLTRFHCPNDDFRLTVGFALGKLSDPCVPCSPSSSFSDIGCHYLRLVPERRNMSSSSFGTACGPTL